MQSNEMNTPDQENENGGHQANERTSQDTGNDNQQRAAGKDELAKDSNSSDINSDKMTTGTDGSNDEKADNTAENARQVRDNDDSEGEE